MLRSSYKKGNADPLAYQYISIVSWRSRGIVGCMRGAHQDDMHLLSTIFPLASSLHLILPLRQRVVEVVGQTLVACRRAVNAALLD